MSVTVVGQRYTLRIRDAEYRHPHSCRCGHSVGQDFKAQYGGTIVVREINPSTVYCSTCRRVTPTPDRWVAIRVWDGEGFSVPEPWLEPPPVEASHGVQP